MLLINLKKGIFYFFVALSCYGTSFNSAAEDKKLNLIAGLAKPPFILEEGQTGLQLEIISQAFALSNIEVKFTHLPLGRNITGFQQWDIDGVITLPKDYKYPGMYVSKPYIDYENVAVSLSAKQLEIESLTDLSDKSLIAFQNAKKYLGEDYNNVVAYLIDYREIADQEKQIKMLFSGRTEVIIADINIFKYFVKTHTDPMFHKLFTIHHIFNTRGYAAGFKKKDVQEAFDRGIKQIKDNGTYQMLLDKYQN